MKTHDSWFKEFSNHGYDQLSRKVVPLRAEDIAAIQADAQQGMVSVEKMTELATAMSTLMEEVGEMADLLCMSEDEEDSTIGSAWKALLKESRKALQAAKQWLPDISTASSKSQHE